MIVLDTNVVSELMRPLPETCVEEGLDRQRHDDVFITAIVEAELRCGAALLPSGNRRDTLKADIEGMLREEFRGRILPFDSAAARSFATVAAERRHSGRPISQFDAQMAAIVRSRGASLASRNIKDFMGCSIPVIDPWDTANA